jgi:hypothetical protein
LISDFEGTPHSSAMLELRSDDKGLLIPRISSEDRMAITNVPGMIVYDTNESSFFLYRDNEWINLSRAEIWETHESPYNSTISLSSNYSHVGIGTYTSTSKFVVQADPEDLDSDILFEVKDKSGNTIFEVTSSGVKVYVKDFDEKGVSGGFAVGKYGAAKGDGDILVMDSKSTNIYVDNETGGKGVSGGFAVGKYGAG